MTRYARRPEHRTRRRGWLGAALAGAGATAARNPVAVGGTTAFVVALAFVAANALWYQPQVHPSAFVSTRALAVSPAPEAVPEPTPAPREEVRAVIDQAEPAPAPTGETTGSVPTTPSGDPTVRAVQKVLQDLGLYRGDVDGLTGPQTREAVENYRRIVGLEPGTDLDGPLLRQLGLEEHAAPTPRPAPREEGSEAVQMASADNSGDSVVSRVQAGLRAFGNEGVEVDGAIGPSTRDAIREFQSLFGLQVTGEVDAELLAKMREIGLIN